MSCNYKLLKNAHIGSRVRMTKDKNTIPFDNKPMTNLLIENYNTLGFQISHPSMGRTIWVAFNQLPLTELTIKNGIIEDEITFVENLIIHQMVLVKTSDPDYIQLIKEREEEKEEEFTTLSKLKSGDKVISALCKEGVEMSYLGTWYTKKVIRNEKDKWHRGYGANRGWEFVLNQNSTRKVFFCSRFIRIII